MLNITFEKLPDYESGRFVCPVLKVTNNSFTAEDHLRYKGIGYLAPFRFYKFQVSMTYDGDCDLGSSNVNYFFKDVIARYNKEDAMNILCQELCKCLNSYLQTRYGYPGYNVAYTFNGEIYNDQYYRDKNLEYIETIELDDTLLQFVIETYYAVAKYYGIDVAA